MGQQSLAHFCTGWAKIRIFIECSILQGTPPAFYTTCILSEVVNALNRCHFNSSLIVFYCHHIHCSTSHARTAHSLLQRQASRPTPTACHHSTWRTTVNSSQALAAGDFDCLMLLPATFHEPARLWAIDPSLLLVHICGIIYHFISMTLNYRFPSFASY